MKINIEFDLSENSKTQFSDKKDLNKMLKSDEMSFALWDIDMFLKNKIKYEDEKYSEDAINAFEEVREVLHSLLENYSLQFILEGD